jgi:hypothetical protein
MRESISGKNLWELENFTSAVFERQVKQLMLDTFFKKKLHFRADYFDLTWQQEHVVGSVCIFYVLIHLCIVKIIMFIPWFSVRDIIIFVNIL